MHSSPVGLRMLQNEIPSRAPEIANAYKAMVLLDLLQMESNLQTVKRLIVSCLSGHEFSRCTRVRWIVEFGIIGDEATNTRMGDFCLMDNFLVDWWAPIRNRIQKPRRNKVI